MSTRLGLREVARAVGVDHAAVSRHFADKRALVAGLPEACYRELVAALEAALRRVPKDDVAARVQRLATAFLRFAYARADLPTVLGHVVAGTLDPRPVTTGLHDWGSAPEVLRSGIMKPVFVRDA